MDSSQINVTYQITVHIQPEIIISPEIIVHRPCVISQDKLKVIAHSEKPVVGNPLFVHVLIILRKPVMVIAKQRVPVFSLNRIVVTDIVQRPEKIGIKFLGFVPVVTCIYNLIQVFQKCFSRTVIYGLQRISIPLAFKPQLIVWQVFLGIIGHLFTVLICFTGGDIPGCKKARVLIIKLNRIVRGQGSFGNPCHHRTCLVWHPCITMAYLCLAVPSDSHTDAGGAFSQGGIVHSHLAGVKGSMVSIRGGSLHRNIIVVKTCISLNGA